MSLLAMSPIPFIVEQNGRSERAYDIYSRLLKDNIIFIGSEIDDDVAIQAKEILRIRDNINDILIKHTHQSRERIQADIERDFIMTPVQAKEYGIIDAIITTREKPKK